MEEQPEEIDQETIKWRIRENITWGPIKGLN
jgi:hypothetical protein